MWPLSITRGIGETDRYTKSSNDVRGYQNRWTAVKTKVNCCQIGYSPRGHGVIKL